MRSQRRQFLISETWSPALVVTTRCTVDLGVTLSVRLRFSIPCQLPVKPPTLFSAGRSEALVNPGHRRNLAH